MTKNVKINVNIDIARKMLVVAGFTNLKSKSDEEIFDLALSMCSEYGVKILDKSN